MSREKRFVTEEVIKSIYGTQEITGIEIGTAAGGWTIYTLTFLPNIKKLYCIDPWQHYDKSEYEAAYAQEYHDNNYNVFINKVKEFPDRNIIPLKMKSEDAINYIEEDFVDFVFIDGHHGYEYIKKDIELYYPRVKKGGFFGGHDYIQTDGVTKAVREKFKEFNTGDDFTWWVIK